ncbi:MFS transporter cpaT-like protein [Cladobotryum mycophilum]|uniref:MFS transporter cpaT-like protein n=1 Tax=Cladobotryum mycophilum TaxID=491253 RepID=A0ABR0SCI9_9HYPO
MHDESIEGGHVSPPTECLAGKEAHSNHIEITPARATNTPLAPEHRQFLLDHHGTIHLTPIPSQDPDDPLNWPAWKKNVNLALVAFHGLMSTGGAVAVVPAFEDWSKKFDISIETASLLGSAQMITLAIGPLIWLPFANQYGRRPVWILSTLGGGLFNIGCALSDTYAVLMVLRILQAFFISPGIAMGQAVVAETFFSHQRARKMGVWTPPMGPFAMGFVVQHLTWQWMFWIMAIINFMQMISYFFFSFETLYSRNISNPSTHVQTTWQQYLNFRKISTESLTWSDILLPLYLLADYRVLLTAVAYTVTFNFTLVLLTVEIPTFFIPMFHLNAQQIGINFLGLFVGCTLGELIGGRLSDYVQNRRSKSAQNSLSSPETRLLLSYPGNLLAIAGIVIFCVTLAEAKPLHWNISPVIGIGVAGFGVQILTTTVITYCSDCHREATSSALGVGINFVRCTWGFIGPFWFPHMFDSCGLRGSAGVMTGVIVAFSLIPVGLVQLITARSSRHS